MILTFQYNSASLFQRFSIQYNDVTHTIVSWTNVSYVVGETPLWAGALLYTQVDGATTYEVRVINTTPLAEVVSYPTPVCAVAITSLTPTNAATNLSSDGQIAIAFTQNGSFPFFTVIGGPDNVNFPTFLQPITGLKAGTYLIRVTNSVAGGCSAEQTVVVGFTNIVCDLALVNIESTVSPGGTITVVNYSTASTEPVEYRIDAGAWQNSPVFTGLAAGTYNVQIRFRNYTSCTANRNVTISNTVYCDLSIDAEVVVPQQSKFANNGQITIIASSTQGPIEYSKNGGGVYQAGNVFASLAPGIYNIRVRDAASCTVDRVVVVPSYKIPFADFPIANAHRVIIETGPPAEGGLQSYDNTLLANMRFPFEKETCNFHQQWLTSDVTRIQWRSNYTNHTARLMRADNTVAATLFPGKITSYLDKPVTNSALLVAGGAGFTQVYFTEGLPYYYEVGQDITISGTPSMNGTYTIQDILPGTSGALGYTVLLLAVAFVGTPPVVATIATVYSVENWEVWELQMNWSAYAAGKYYLTISGTDLQFDPFSARSEPIELATEHPDTLLLEYVNKDNAFLMDYTTGIVNKLRISARVGLPRNAGQIVGMEDSVRRYIKLNEYVTRIHDFEVWDVPFYLMEKIQIALAHDTVTINGIAFATEEKMEVQDFESEVTMHGKAKIRKIEFENENKTDSTSETTMSILSLDRYLYDCGPWDATPGTYPAVGGNGFGGTIKRGNWFIVSVASPPDVNGDVKFPVGCTLQALIDNPGQIDSNWKKVVA